MPMRFDAEPMSMIVRESTWEEVRNAMREGMFALIRPVMTLTSGLCVPMMRCMPAALAFCAMRQIDSSTSSFAVIMRSASSSITMTMDGRYS